MTQDEKIKQAQKRIKDNEDMGEIMRLRRWEKFYEYPSFLPDKLVYKLETEAQGAFKLKFSNSGQYLAAACTMEGITQLNKTKTARTIIKIHDIESGKHCANLSGHGDLVHDLAWTRDDKFLLSASADGSCKLWNIQDIQTNNPDAHNHIDNDDLFFVIELYHPSFVYGAKIHPQSTPDYLYVATACYDKKVRIWQITVEDVDEANNVDNVEFSMLQEMDINDRAEHEVGAKKGFYENDDNLEDDMLRLIMNPQENEAAQKMGSASKKKGKKLRKTEE